MEGELLKESPEIRQISHDFRDYILDVRDYQKIKLIGRGGYAEVWLVSRFGSSETIAMKQLFNEVTEKQIHHFAREVRTMADTNHPFFLKFLGFSPHTPLSIFSEYIPNGSLLRFIRSDVRGTKLTGTHRTLIAMGVANAMSSLHEHGIVHRDLKSMNILLDEKLLPRICDFGIARFNTGAEGMTMRLGTPHWMAPESLYGKGYSYPVDVYSFGMLLYELLTYKIPWEGMEPIAVTKSVVYDKARPKLPEKLPEALRSLITACWEHNPRRRPSFATIYKAFENCEVFFEGTNFSEVNELANFLKDFPVSEPVKVKRKAKKKLNASAKAKSAQPLVKDEAIVVKDEATDAKTSVSSASKMVRSSTQLVQSSTKVNQDQHARSNPSLSTQRSSESLPKSTTEGEPISVGSAPAREQMSSRSDSLFHNNQFTVIDQKVDSKEFMREAAEILQNSNFEKKAAVLKAMSSFPFPYSMRDYKRMNIQTLLPIEDPDLYEITLNVVHATFSTSPEIYNSAFKPKMQFIIKKSAQKALILLSLYSLRFSKIPDPWSLLDLLFLEAPSFMKGTDPVQYLSLLYFLNSTYPEYREARIKESQKVAIALINRSDIEANYAGWRFLSLYPTIVPNKRAISHITNPRLSKYVLACLSQCNMKSINSALLSNIVNLTAQLPQATNFLVNLITNAETADLIIQEGDWLSRGCPSYEDTFKLFLAVTLHTSDAKLMFQTRHFSDFITNISLSDDQSMFVYLCGILQKLCKTHQILTCLSESGSLECICKKFVDSSNSQVMKASMLLLISMSRIGHSPEFLIVCPKLRSLLKTGDSLSGYALETIVTLSDHPLCAMRFKEMKLERYFRTLLFNPDYVEDAKKFLSNLETTQFYERA